MRAVPAVGKISPMSNFSVVGLAGAVGAEETEDFAVFDAQRERLSSDRRMRLRQKPKGVVLRQNRRFRLPR